MLGWLRQRSSHQKGKLGPREGKDQPQATQQVRDVTCACVGGGGMGAEQRGQVRGFRATPRTGALQWVLVLMSVNVLTTIPSHGNSNHPNASDSSPGSSSDCPGVWGEPPPQRGRTQ